MTEKQKIKLEMEKERIKGMREFENGIVRETLGTALNTDAASEDIVFMIAGIDEAGRGPLAGPVAAGAVILPADHDILYLNDSKKLSAKKVDKILSKALSIKDGYLKNGVRFEGGLYSNDGKTDLDIAIFISGASKDNVVYIIRENGKIVDYGMDITATTDKLSDGTEYVKLACKVGEAQKDATYVYNFEKSFLVTSTGAKVSAVEISDLDYAWNIQSMAE